MTTKTNPWYVRLNGDRVCFSCGEVIPFDWTRYVDSQTKQHYHFGCERVNSGIIFQTTPK